MSDVSGLEESTVNKTNVTDKTKDSILEKTRDSSLMEKTNDRTSSYFSSRNETSDVMEITSTLSSTGISDIEKSRQATKQLLLKKQLLHDIQKLKIELSQKSLLMDTMKAEHLNQVDDLEDKLSDAMHAKQMTQAKYETHLQMLRDQSSKAVQKLKGELHNSQQLLRTYKDKCTELSHCAGDVRSQMVLEEITQEQFDEIKYADDNSLTIKQLFNKNVYQHIFPLRVQVESLSQRTQILAADLREREDENITQKQMHEGERLARVESDIRCQKLQVQIEDLRSQLSHKHYKNENYDNVQGERDSINRKLIELEKQCTVYKSELDGKSHQMENIRSQLMEQTQTLALLKQDKEYLSKQLNELTPRYKVLEERFQLTTKQLDDAKLSREELYEKHLNSRDIYKQEYEERMRREMEEMTTKTNMEMQRLKEASKEVYERENRILREAKENAVNKQERLTLSEKQCQQKYNDLLSEFRLLQISSGSKVSEKESEMQMKSFELDRLQMLYGETMKTHKDLTAQNDTLSLKLETLSKEYYAMEASSNKTISELEGRNQDMSLKLSTYEKLEQELDDVIMQAAEVENEVDSERVLFAYGYGANVPSTAKRRMQQSVQLARRVLQLERANTSLKKERDRETEKCRQVSGELKNSTSLLNEAQQPYNYLIESIKTRDSQNTTLKNTISTLQQHLKELKDANDRLKCSNDRMTSDLEKLLNQKEEMAVLKEVVHNMKSSRHNETLKKSTDKSYLPKCINEASVTPENPIIFTKSDNTWYERLRKQNDMKRSNK